MLKYIRSTICKIRLHFTTYVTRCQSKHTSTLPLPLLTHCSRTESKDCWHPSVSPEQYLMTNSSVQSDSSQRRRGDNARKEKHRGGRPVGHACLKLSHWNVKAKVKLSHYRAGEALRAPGGYGSQDCLDSRHIKAVRLSALGTGRLYPRETSLVLISVSDRVVHRAVLRTKGLCQWQIKMTPYWEVLGHYLSCRTATLDSGKFLTALFAVWNSMYFRS